MTLDNSINLGAMGISFFSLIVSTISLLYIKSINRKAEEMNTEVWTNITDSSMIQTANIILSMKKDNQDITPLFQLWLIEFDPKSVSNEEKLDNEKYWNAYEKAYNSLKNMIINKD